MTELNRRSLLAMLASAPLFGELIAQAQRRQPKPRQTRSEYSKRLLAAPPKWPISSTPPLATNPGVRLIFQGLTVFSHKGKQAEVAFIRDVKHKVEVRIFENCKQVFATTDVTDQIFIEKMSIEVDGKDSDASFFHVGPPGEFNRTTGDLKDFWWLLDLESIYGKKLDKEKSKTTLTVKNGQFYTYQRTNSTFKGVNGPFPADGEPLEYIAKVMATDIKLSLGESVLFKINGNEVFRPLTLKPGTRYEVYFSNECFKSDGTKCDGDFDLNFKITKLQPQEKFRLDLEVPGDDDPPPNLCITNDYIKHRQAQLKQKRVKKRGTDRFPCMGVGFGEGGGFPDP